MIRSLALAAAALLATLLVAACGDNAEPQSEDYGNLLNSPGGLVVLREEHPTGWARPDCFACHNVLNMHTVNRTGLPSCRTLPQPPTTGCVDLDEIQLIIDNEGQDSCMQCHGDNGVRP
ncbi:MAG: hypothetical protein U0802_15900 [Candidatus Binatia bacterium]